MISADAEEHRLAVMTAWAFFGSLRSLLDPQRFR